jgi:Exostosin family
MGIVGNVYYSLDLHARTTTTTSSGNNGGLEKELHHRLQRPTTTTTTTSGSHNTKSHPRPKQLPAKRIWNVVTNSSQSANTSQPQQDPTPPQHPPSVAAPPTTTATTTLHGVTIRVPNNYQYLLNVPFYIYEEWGAPTYPHATLTLGGRPFDIRTLDKADPTHQNYHVIHGIHELKAKHADDIYLMAAAVHHPMRTLDPGRAKLFVIPTPFNMLIDTLDGKNGENVKLCWELHYTQNNNNNETNNNIKNTNGTTPPQSPPPLCNFEWAKHVDTELSLSPWYRRHKGLDHIAIMSHWRWLFSRANTRFGGLKWKPQRIHKCQLIDFEGKLGKLLQRKKHRLAFPSYYVGKKCPVVAPEPRKYDFSMVATLNPIGRATVFQDRINVCDWIRANNHDIHNKTKNKKTSTNETLSTSSSSSASSFGVLKMNVCGLGTQCPTMTDARFVIHAKGDTDGSNRLMDGLLTHTIPIFTRTSQYDVLPHWIDWKALSYFANISDRTTFIKDLFRIQSKAEEESSYRQKFQTIRDNTDLFDYETVVPFDTYMYMFQAALFPELKRDNLKSPYSALLLP